MSGGLILPNNAKMIEGDDQIRAQKCAQMVHDVCNTLQCAMLPRLEVTADGVRSSVSIEGPNPDKSQTCSKRVNEVLGMFDCGLYPKIILKPGRIDGEVGIIAKNRKGPGNGNGKG